MVFRTFDTMLVENIIGTCFNLRFAKVLETQV